MILYDLDDAFEAEVDPETGELIESAEARRQREALLAELDARIDRWCDAVREIEARAAARQAEAERIAELARLDAAKAKRLRQAIQWAMETTGRHRIEGARNRVALVQNGGKRPIDIMVPVEELPHVYVREIRRLEPDMDALRAALEAGEIIPGAVLMERGRHLRIK